MITNFQTASICNVTVVKIIQSTKQKFLYHKNVNLVFPIMINAANNKCSDVSIFKGKARKVDYMSSCKLRENICFYMTGNKDGRRGAKPKKTPGSPAHKPLPSPTTGYILRRRGGHLSLGRAQFWISGIRHHLDAQTSSR